MWDEHCDKVWSVQSRNETGRKVTKNIHLKQILRELWEADFMKMARKRKQPTQKDEQEMKIETFFPTTGGFRLPTGRLEGEVFRQFSRSRVEGHQPLHDTEPEPFPCGQQSNIPLSSSPLSAADSVHPRSSPMLTSSCLHCWRQLSANTRLSCRSFPF
jgi:hypothetical protein